MVGFIRKSFWFGLAGVLALLAVGAVAEDGLNVNDGKNTTTTTTTEKGATDTATIKLEGKGRQATAKFTLEPGLAIINTTHFGKSNFVAYLVNNEGEEVQSLFNYIGKYEATRGFEITKAGEYVLNVQADGNWTFAINQPRPTTGESTPRTINGKRTEVSPFLSLKKGLAVFKYDYQGNSRFSVTLMDRNGRAIEQIANSLKATEGSAPVKIQEDGIYFLNISADANWQIDVQ
jgi:hypothetical protein